MPPPTALAIKTSAVTRLVKEEASYHKELALQLSRLDKLKAQEGADEYAVKQQTTVVDQTRKVIPPVRDKLKNAVEALEFALEANQSDSEENKQKAKEAIEKGKKVAEEADKE